MFWNRISKFVRFFFFLMPWSWCESLVLKCQGCCLAEMMTGLLGTLIVVNHHVACVNLFTRIFFICRNEGNETWLWIIPFGNKQLGVRDAKSLGTVELVQACVSVSCYLGIGRSKKTHSPTRFLCLFNVSTSTWSGETVLQHSFFSVASPRKRRITLAVNASWLSSARRGSFLFSSCPTFESQTSALQKFLGHIWTVVAHWGTIR